jgi:hypothetical protein
VLFKTGAPVVTTGYRPRTDQHVHNFPERATLWLVDNKSAFAGEPLAKDIMFVMISATAGWTPAWAPRLAPTATTA